MRNILHAEKRDVCLFRYFEETCLLEYKITQLTYATRGLIASYILLIPFVISIIAASYVLSVLCLFAFLALPYVYNTISMAIAQVASNILLDKMFENQSWLQMCLLYRKIMSENKYCYTTIGIEEVSSSPWDDDALYLLCSKPG